MSSTQQERPKMRKPSKSKQVVLEALQHRQHTSEATAMKEGWICGAVQLNFRTPEQVTSCIASMLDTHVDGQPTPLVERSERGLWITEWGIEALARCESTKWLDPSVEANWSKVSGGDS